MTRVDLKNLFHKLALTPLSSLATSSTALSQKLVKIAKINRTNIVFLILFGLTVYFLLPRLGQVGSIVSALQQAHTNWLIASLLASVATYFVSSRILQYSASRGLMFSETLMVSLASSFANAITPGGIGGISLSIRYLQIKGLTIAKASSITAIIRIAGVTSTIILLPILLLVVQDVSYRPAAPRLLTVLITSIALLLVTSIILLSPKLRKATHSFLRDLLGHTLVFVRSGKVPWLLFMSTFLTLVYSLSFYFALLSVGLHVNLFYVTLVYIAGSSLGAAVPTPGGVGVTEAALISGLAIFGVAAGPAVAGVLLFRLMTFWLPLIPGIYAFRWLVKHKNI